MTNIFIANLDFSITTDDLKATFSQFGEVSYAHVVYDNKTKKSRGFGYIEMEDTSQAIQAIEALNGMEVNGRKLDVKVATPKPSRKDRLEGKKTEAKKERSFEKKAPPKKKEVKDAPIQKRRVLRPRRKKSE